MTTRVAVLGAGAIGAPIGGLLTRAGHDVVLIDQWPAHVEAMRTRGLRLTIGSREDPEAEHTVAVRALHVHEVCALREPLDVIFLASKAYDSAWMAQLVEPYLASDGVVVPVQNSLTDEWVSPIVGPERDIGCVLTAGGELLGPGHAWRNRGLDVRYYTLGELGGQLTPRLERVAAILGDAGKTATTTNIRGAKWTKLVSNCVSAALSGLVDARKRSWDLIDDPAYRRVSATLYKEGAAVGAALGYAMEPLFGMTAEELLRSPDEVLGPFIAAKSRGASKGAINMIQQDLGKGRPTEVVGYLNGLMVRKGRQAGIPTPANAAMTSLYVRLERGEIQPGRANLELLESATRGGKGVAAARS